MFSNAPGLIDSSRSSEQIDFEGRAGAHIGTPPSSHSAADLVNAVTLSITELIHKEAKERSERMENKTRELYVRIKNRHSLTSNHDR